MLNRRIATEIGTAVLFLVASLIGLVMALELESVSPTNPSQNTSAGFGYVIYFIVAVILMSVVILYISKKKRLGILRIIFVLSMVFVIYIVSSLLYALLPITYPEYYFLSFGTPVLFLYLLLFKQNWIVINIAGILTAAGLAAIWGVDLGLYAAIVLMIVFAIYDYIAVYKTKHMLDIARATAISAPVVASEAGIDIELLLAGRRMGTGTVDAILRILSAISSACMIISCVKERFIGRDFIRLV